MEHITINEAADQRSNRSMAVYRPACSADVPGSIVGSLFKRILCSVLVLAMVFSVLPRVVFASQNEVVHAEDETEVQESVSSAEQVGQETLSIGADWAFGSEGMSRENLETLITAVSRQMTAKGDKQVASYSWNGMDDSALYEICATQINTLRKAMVNRQTTITVRISYSMTAEAWQLLAQYMVEKAVEHTGNPVEGDYLAYQIQNWKATGYRGSSYANFTYTLTYATTKEQEQAVDKKVAAILSELDVYSLSELDRIVAIYSWICNNVHYSVADAHTTAYQGLIVGECACQGYSVILYRLLNEAGIESHILDGYGGDSANFTGSANHCWNIAWLDGIYYLLDVTWDQGGGGQDFRWLLHGTEDWPDHYNLTDKYLDYSISARNYDFGTPAIQLYRDYNQQTDQVSGKVTSLKMAAGSFIVGNAADPYGPLYLKIISESPLQEGELITTKRFTITLPNGFSFEPDKIVTKKENESIQFADSTDKSVVYPVYPLFIDPNKGTPQQLEFTLSGDITETLTLKVQKSSKEGEIYVDRNAGIIGNAASYRFVQNPDIVNWASSAKTSYRQDMAKYCGALAFSIYSSENVSASLQNLGYSEVWYRGSGTMTTGYVLAKRKIIVNEQVKNVVLIGVRGTSNLDDLVTDLFAVGVKSPNHFGFDMAKESIYQSWKIYCEDMDLSNTYVIITGHSLGGSVANLLAHDINAAQETAGVSCYTFAAANCTEQPQADGNIFNLVFAQDLVGFIPGGGFGKHGSTYYFGSGEIPVGVRSYYQNLTGCPYFNTNSEFLISFALYYPKFLNYIPVGLGTILYNISVHPESEGEEDAKLPLRLDVINAHQAENYLSWLMSGNATSTVSLGTLRALYPASSFLNALDKFCNAASIFMKEPLTNQVLSLISTQSGMLRTFVKNTINKKQTTFCAVRCPVDIEVYSAAGERILQIVDHQVVYCNEDQCGAFVDGTQHYILMPEGEQYQFVLNGTGNGFLSTEVLVFDADMEQIKHVTSNRCVVSPDYQFSFKLEAVDMMESIEITNTNPLAGGVIFLPDNLNRIEQEAFAGNSEIVNVIFPQSCTEIGARAFSDCFGLRMVCIPNGDCTIAADAFDQQRDLVIMTVSGSRTAARAAELGFTVLDME